MYAIILCGGSGTRLWPLSRKNYPKQFLNLYSDKSLLQETYLRARVSMPAERIFLVTSKDNFFTAINQIRDVEENFNKDRVLIEPVSLGDLPAMLFAVKHLREKIRVNENEQIVLLQSDHYIGNLENYLKVIENAAATNGDHVGIIGITPTVPNTGLGYILKGEKKDSHFSALAFKEKPDAATALEYVNSGKYVWNSAIYLFNTKTFLQELSAHTPTLYDYALKDFPDFIRDYPSIPPTIFAFNILEKTKNIAIYEGGFGWRDIGSFDTLAEILGQQENERYIAVDSKDNFVHSDSNRLVVALGVSNLNIIETADSILIQRQRHGEGIKKAIEEMKKRNFPELEHSLIVHRSWGKYEILIESPTHRVKKTTMYPGAKINLQSHSRRTEHWIIIKGTAKVNIGGKEKIIRENESAFVPPQVKHGLENCDKIPLVIIEVQTGTYLGEDDTITYDIP